MAFQIGHLFLSKHKITLFYLLLFVLIRSITRCHSLSFIVIFYYSLSFVVIRCLLLYHSLSLVFIRCTTRCHSLSFVVPLVVIWCSARLSYKRSLFHQFLLFTSFIIKSFKVMTASKLNSSIYLVLQYFGAEGRRNGTESREAEGRGPRIRGRPRFEEHNYPFKEKYFSFLFY